ncbi:S10 family peptidase [Rubrivivax benzoatilyticus]|uniref:Peptidase S10 n=1 Tax=Rubrivivax benzoatilyticus TaxID=316997 RepID=A0ABX0HVF0_9BURK|nr:peptidase S10 [Rubrivivax benzoatilyticus]EGJ11993.1 peptidase S10 serine carboxypeptidase [Rubrivivax benzoatilyticus JA2 = ATCC BAA-35]NHK97513.1 peptidase S10 [Rubrivivax benzoatilyticus]NHL22792.1 peptidase S10 [Rubrivivax benzoatilyticus]
MADTPTPPDPDKTSDRRHRERVEQLLARPPVRAAGTLALADRRLDYAVSAEFIPVAGEGFDGALAEPQAAVMTTAYQLQGAAAGSRPVCFAFNGGPGSASIWLHLGALGPKRLVVPSDGSMPAAPYTVSDNPLSWFEHFDLVFVDPPHTGWSTTASEAARKKLLSVDGDVKALAEVVRTWLTRHRRWGSPVYLAGESYGTTRGAALADKLLDGGVALAGLVLVSCAMDLQSLSFDPGNDLPYALFLPAYAVVSQYHGLLKGPLGASREAAQAAAEAFVDEDYAAALLAGARLSDKRRAAVARRVAELTGLPRALVEEKNLRIADQDYFFEAMRAQGRQVGRLDARVTGPMAARRTRDWEFDPGIEAIAAPYTMAAMAYFGELGLTTEQRYETLSHEAHLAWNWNRGEAQGNAYASTSRDLARALRRNPQLKVFVASGRYDLGTPYSASDWSLAQLDAPSEVLARIEHHYYDAGHMMYTREEDLTKLKADIAHWLG